MVGETGDAKRVTRGLQIPPDMQVRSELSAAEQSDCFLRPKIPNIQEGIALFEDSNYEISKEHDIDARRGGGKPDGATQGIKKTIEYTRKLFKTIGSLSPTLVQKRHKHH